MTVKTYRGEFYRHSQENEGFDRFCRLCLEHLTDKGDVRVLGNIRVGRYELDALVLSPRSITIVDFKGYGGEVFTSETDAWTLADGTEVKGGSYRNPFAQLLAYKNGLEVWLRQKADIPPDTNLRHITGLVLFTSRVSVTNEFSPTNKGWFTAAGLSEGMGWLHDRSSPQLMLDTATLDHIVSLLQVEPYQVSRVDQIAVDAKHLLDRELAALDDARQQQWWQENGAWIAEQQRALDDQERREFERVNDSDQADEPTKATNVVRLPRR